MIRTPASRFGFSSFVIANAAAEGEMARGIAAGIVGTGGGRGTESGTGTGVGATVGTGATAGAGAPVGAGAGAGPAPGGHGVDGPAEGRHD